MFSIRRTLFILQSIFILPLAMANPESDRESFSAYYKDRFPGVELTAHVDGAYALDAQKKEQWLAMEDFPPYEFAIDDGETLFNAPFSNGKTYAACFENDGAVKHLYPYFDTQERQVVTLAVALNKCRELNDEETLDYASEDIALLSTYIAYISRDEKINIKIGPEGRAAYEKGKQYYYSRRGQLNFACSHCHMQMSGMKLRAETLSASLGHVTHWPTYRFKWQEVGGLHKRFIECNEQVGAEGLAMQSETYRNLEYFLSFMSQGMPINGPASRK